MSHTDQWEKLLKRALAPELEPEARLNQRMIEQLKIRNGGKRVYRKRFSAGAIAVAIALVMSLTAVAATQLFNSKQVVEHMGDRILASAFDSSDAIEINQTASSGDYHFTLHGIVSGSGLSELEGSAAEIHPERTYAVVSITRQDGKPMPHTSDPEYGEEPFFISPFVKGQKPWQVNIATMGGSYSDTVIDGVMYRLIECDGVVMFADKGVYLAISSGSPFYSSDAFAYNESTGEISAKTDYDGASLLFELPLDQAKADPAKAEAYLEKLLDPRKADPSETTSEQVDPEGISAEIKDRFLTEGTVIPESVKEVTIDEQGRLHYEYDIYYKVMYYSADYLFRGDQTGFSALTSISKSGDNEGNVEYSALQFHKDEEGVITGRVIVLK